MRIIALILSLVTWLPALAADATTNRSVILMAFFRGNGEEGLYLATSRDGLKFEEIKGPGKTFIRPTVGGKLMRDPFLALGPDGVFHLTWTTGWGKPPVIGYANSKDLINWSEQKAIPVMAQEPGAMNAWAPELFYDEIQKQWMIFWSTTIPGRFPETEKTGDDKNNHRIYYTTTRDFEQFAPTKLLFNDGFNVIDATMLKANGRYHLIVKDETKVPVKKNLRIATAEHAAGPYSPASVPISTNNWVEGPAAIKVGNEYLIYYDHYARPQYYGALKSTDLKSWQEIADRVSFPSGVRHSSVLWVPEAVVEKIKAKP